MQSFRNLTAIRGALTLAVYPDVAFAACGQWDHHGALLPAALQVPLEGQVVQTLLLHALKEESEQPSAVCCPAWPLGSSPLPVGEPGTAQVENGTQWPSQGVLFLGA